jgi:hypothetical protein
MLGACTLFCTFQGCNWSTTEFSCKATPSSSIILFISLPNPAISQHPLQDNVGVRGHCQGNLPVNNGLCLIVKCFNLLYQNSTEMGRWKGIWRIVYMADGELYDCLGFNAMTEAKRRGLFYKVNTFFAE